MVDMAELRAHEYGVHPYPHKNRNAHANRDP